MTREEILAMEPGRELDKLIAVHVMRWQMYHYDKDVEENCYYMLLDDEMEPVADFESYSFRVGERSTEEEAWNDNHKFSNDISAAWEVVEKMKQNNWFFILSDNLFPDKWEASFFWDPNQEMIDLISNSAPEAICKAALLAVLPGEE